MIDLSDILSSPVLVQPGAHDPYTRRELRNLDLAPLFADGHRHVWLGHFPPFDCLALDLARSTGFRASAWLHGRFDVVWCVAPEAFDEGNWPIVIDEALRLLGARGFLVLRFPADFSRMVRVKSFLARKFGVSARIVDELQTAEGLLAIVAIERAGTAALADDRWTIGILTSGKRDRVVERMLRSIREGAGGDAHEILLFGPPNEDLGRYRVRYLDEAAHGINPALNEIARKKNAIAAEAAHENLLICHDRYYLQPGFLESFARFGQDFDFATASQVYEDGQPFPALGAVGGLRIDRLDHISDVSRFVDEAYVNGGFMLIKRALMRAIPLNEMCFWNQGEDAEYAAILRERGVVPRYNPLATAVTDGVGKKHCAAFRDAFDGTPVLLRYNRGGQSTGLRYHWDHGSYRVSEVGAALPEDASLSLSVDQPDAGAIVAATLDIRPAAPGQALAYRVAGGGWQRIAVPGDGAPVRLSALVEAAGGRAVVDFRAGQPASGAPALPSETATAAEFTLVDLRHVRPLQIEFARGSFGREGAGAAVWHWLAAEARLVLLNANPFPVAARLAFAFQHAAAGGATRLSVAGTGGVDLIGGSHEAPVPFAMTMLLQPGATSIALSSFGAALETPPPNELRPLSMRLDTPTLESLIEPEVSAAGWAGLDRWFAAGTGGDGERADSRSDDAVLIQPGMLPADQPLFVTMEGRFREYRRAGERLGLLLDGRHAFEDIEEVDGRICLRIDAEIRGSAASMLLTPVAGDGAALHVDRLRLSLDEPFDAPVAIGRHDRRIAPGDTVSLTVGASGAEMLGEGWWAPEPDFCWTRSRRATMELPIAWPAGKGATLFLDVSTLCAPDLDFAPRVTVCVGGEPLHEWQPASRDRETVAVPIDAAAMAGDTLSVAILQSDVSSPHALWGLGDDRLLGMSVASVRLS